MPRAMPAPAGTTPMQHDVRGIPLTTMDRGAVEELDAAVRALLGQRAEAPARLQAALLHDPGLAAGHALAGFLHLLAARRPQIAEAGACLARARATIAARGATHREAALVEALALWQAQGEMRGAAELLDAALAEAPHDLLLIRLVQAIRFMLGDAAGMRRSLERLLPAWHEALPGYGHVLGCHAFALGETGDLLASERVGRAAVARQPDDLWAAHAVAHAMGGLRRLREGVAWIAWLEPQLAGGSNFVRHLHWHRALFHLALGEGEEALALYDRRVRDAPSPITRDILDAASLLWRIEAAGGPRPGARWQELADLAEQRIGDHAWAFADLHYVLCLAAAGRREGVAAMLDSIRARSEAAGGTQDALRGEVGLAAAEAIADALGGDAALAAARLDAVAGRLPRLGGSHAQRDLLRRIHDRAKRESGQAAAGAR